jgi:superfamily I DNA/RNA helicase
MRTSITFGDLVPLAVEILRKGDVARNAVRQTYSHVFLDEFQDCTDSQYSLVKTAFQGTGIQLTAVGDTKQRIMGWAGALEGIFLKYKNDFGALALNLYQNFRSKPRLRRMQNRMVKVLEPAAAVDDSEIEGDEGEIRVEHFDDSLAEAEAIAEWVDDWIRKEKIQHPEIAILVSKQPDLYTELVMAELQSRGIPFRNEQTLQDLSAEPIARLIIDFLLVVFGEREPDAFGRLMGVLSFSGQDDDSAQHNRWRSFLDETRKSQADTATINIDGVRTLITKFLKELGAALVRSLSAEYEQGPYLNTKIKETADRIAELWDQGGSLLQALSRFSEDRAVRILTIHKSKGLEFHSVILMAVEHQAFFGKIDDERAAFFVGISRAKQRLVLTSVDQRPRPEAAKKRWDEKRAPQEEFLGYAEG